MRQENLIEKGYPAIEDLPIFQVRGGDALLREDFVGKLQERADLLNLNIAVVKEGEILNPFELVYRRRLHDCIVVNADRNLGFMEIVLGQRDVVCEGELFCENTSNCGMERFLEQLVQTLDGLIERTPVWACILIGGKSSRMGTPKHLITEYGDRSWLEQTVESLRPFVEEVVVAGKGGLPSGLSGITRTVDAPGGRGPLGGIVGAMRYNPFVSWLIVACDMPAITGAAVRWLLAGRRCGCWGRVPQLPENDYCEPLLAWYDGRAIGIFEEQLFTKNFKVGAQANHFKFDNPLIPDNLRSSWQNINTPEQLRLLKDDKRGSL